MSEALQKARKAIDDAKANQLVIEGSAAKNSENVRKMQVEGFIAKISQEIEKQVDNTLIKLTVNYNNEVAFCEAINQVMAVFSDYSFFVRFELGMGGQKGNPHSEQISSMSPSLYSSGRDLYLDHIYMTRKSSL